MLAVDKRYRKRGIGKELVRFVELLKITKAQTFFQFYGLKMITISGSRKTKSRIFNSFAVNFNLESFFFIKKFYAGF